jgi:alpha-tubulin suppressor-like RCC1 family protein
VVTWGEYYYDPTSVLEGLSDVQTIVTNNGAFAALKTDGSVVTWGSGWAGGDSSAVASVLTDVQTISNTNDAFAALKTDGTVVTWGNSYSGGDSTGVDLTDVQTIFSTTRAFAALKTDGSVVTWGDRGYGADSSAVASELTDVQTIFGGKFVFAALKTDGSVVTWGQPDYGGDSSAVAADLAGVSDDVWSMVPSELGGPCEGSSSPCGDGTSWDAAAGTCTAAPPLNCFQSGYCQGADDYWSTGLPNSILGNGTFDDCYGDPPVPGPDVVAWDLGYALSAGPTDLTALCE